MDFREALGTLESSPIFAKWSYKTQVKARQRLIDAWMPQIPEMAALDPQRRAEVVRRLVYRPPAMETPEGRADIEQTQSRLAEYSKAGKLSKGSVVEQLRSVPGNLAGGWVSTQSTLLGMEKESMLFGLRRTFSRALPKMTYEIMRGVLGEDNPNVQSAKRLAEWVPAHFRDADKWEEWVDATLSTDKQYRDLAHNITKGAGKLSVNIAELSVASTLAQAPLGIAGFGAGASTRLGAAVGKGLKFTRFGVDTGVEFARELVKSWEKDPEKSYTFSQMISTFGETAAWNVLGLTAAKVLPKVGKTLKGVFIGERAARGMDAAQLAKAYDDLFSGRTMDPALFANLDDDTRAAFRAAENFVAVATNVKERTPENMLAALATANDYDLVKTASGYRLNPLIEGMDPHNFKSLESLERWMGNELVGAINRGAKESATMAAASRNLRLSYSSDWVNALAVKKYGTGLVQTTDGYIINEITEEGDQVPRVFKNIREAGDYLLHGSTKDGFVDAALAPDGAVLIEGQKRFTYTGTVATGTRRDIYNHLARFRDADVYKARHPMLQSGKYSLDNSLNHFELVDEATGFRAEFQTADEAIDWLKLGEDDLIKNADIAARKGYRLGFAANKVALYTDEGDAITFDTVQDAIKGLDNARVPEWAPELTGIDTRLAAELGPRVDLQDHVWKQRKASEIGSLAMNFRPSASVVEQAVRKLGAPPELESLFGKVVTAREAHEAYRSAGYDVIHQAFSPAGGKMIKRETAAELHLMLKAETREAAVEMLAKINAKRKKPLNPALIEIWDRVHAFRGESDGPGLAGFGQIGQRMEEGPYVLGYVPELTEKVQAWMYRNPNKHFSDTDVMRVLTEAGVDEAHLPFFRHARKDDIVKLAEVADPITAFERVYDVITREKFLAPALDNLAKGVETAYAAGNLNSDVYNYLREFVDVAYGRVKDVDYKRLKSELAIKLAKPLSRMGLVAKETDNFIDLVVSLSYSSSLGFRPYPVVRNMISQPLMLIAPAMGWDYTGRAMKELVDPKRQGEIMDLLRRKGMMLGDTHGNVGIDLPIPTGLKAFRRSDDYTRAIAYLTTKYRMDEARALFTSGRLKDMTSLLRRSGLAKMDEAVQKEAVAHLKAGNWEAAHDLFARRFSFEVLFPYAKAYNPTWLRGRGVVGKMFGQFGTYSGWYIDAVRKFSFERGDLWDKVGFAARLGAGAGIASTAAAAMGLRWSRDWAPWGPAMFSGGPYFDLAVSMLDLMKPGYPSRQARAELFGVTEQDGKMRVDPMKLINGQVSRLLVPIPGRVQLDYLGRALNYINEGDPYKGLLAIMSAPIDPKYER